MHVSTLPCYAPRCATIIQCDSVICGLGGLVGLMEDSCVMLRCSICACVCSPWIWGFVLYFVHCFRQYNVGGILDGARVASNETIKAITVHSSVHLELEALDFLYTSIFRIRATGSESKLGRP